METAKAPWRIAHKTITGTVQIVSADNLCITDAHPEDARRIVEGVNGFVEFKAECERLKSELSFAQSERDEILDELKRTRKVTDQEAADVTVSVAGAEAYMRAADHIDAGATTKDLRTVAYAILDTCRKNAMALTTPNAALTRGAQGIDAERGA